MATESVTESADTSQKRVEKKLWLVTALCVIALFGFVGLWQRHHADPVVDIPTPIMPNPNAWDFYVKASRAAVVTNAMHDAIYPQPASTKVLSFGEKEALLQPNALALKTLRQGFAYPCLNPPQRDSINFKPLAGFRNLARLLSFESLVKRERGDFAGAANSCIDAVRLGSEVPRGGNFITMLVGVAVESIGRKPMWKVVDKLDAREARASVKRLEIIESNRQPYADTLREEKYSGQVGLLQMFRDPNWHRGFNQDAWGTEMGTIDRVRVVTTSKRTFFDNYSNGMDALTIEAQKPYPQQQEPPLPDDPYSKGTLRVYGRGSFHVVRSQADNRLLIAALALRAYFVEHKSYPTTLQELAPKYFKSVPDDPFAIKSPLRYKKQGAKYVLWSIGPDAVDNGGRAALSTIFRSNPSPSQKHNIDQQSRGDFVAGVNH